MASAATLLAPTATAFASEAPGSAPRLEFALEALVEIDPTVEVGETSYGMRRRVAITGGTFSGPEIRGVVLAGGADWQLQRRDNYVVLEADYMIRADDGALIHVYNKGLSNSHVPGVHERYVRTVPSFEAPSGPHEWLNRFVFVGTLDPSAGAPPRSVRVRVFKVL